jgi:hypothetical protein
MTLDSTVLCKCQYKWKKCDPYSQEYTYYTVFDKTLTNNHRYRPVFLTKVTFFFKHLHHHNGFYFDWWNDWLLSWLLIDRHWTVSLIQSNKEKTHCSHWGIFHTILISIYQRTAHKRHMNDHYLRDWVYIKYENKDNTIINYIEKRKCWANRFQNFW